MSSFAYARRAGQGLVLQLAGTEVTCRPAGSLWVADWRTLVVADLHLEKGSSYASRGQMLPPFDTVDTLARLEAEVSFLSPRMIVFLGDSFHDRRGESRLTASAVARLSELGRERSLIWVAGNHDAGGPAALPGENVSALVVAGLLLTHQPEPGTSPGEIAGHLHPCARVNGAGRRRCFITDGERLILPAFGAYAGGLNVRHPAVAELLGRARLAAVLGTDRVHPVAWAALGED